MRHIYSMSKRAFLICTAIVMLAGEVNAQEMIISFPAGNMTVERSLINIEKQTVFRFTYSRNVVDVSRNVVFNGADMSLEKALEHILEGAGLAYSVQGKYILLHKGELPAKTRQIQGYEMPTARGGEIYIYSGIEVHNNVNRIRELPVPDIQVNDTAMVVMDSVRSRNTDHYTSYYFSARQYMDNELPAFALKMNLLHGIGALAPNLGVEFGLGGRTSLELYGAVNAWRLQSNLDNNRKLAHILVRPEFRFWTCERFNGHFFGVNTFFTHYNIGAHDIPLLFDKKYRYDGIGIGAGVTYGYFLAFDKRWGMEFNIGAGVMWMDYDRFDCTGCEKSSEPFTKWYAGLTRAGITIVFNIK